mgnify:CR=1 FL=1
MSISFYLGYSFLAFPCIVKLLIIEVSMKKLVVSFVEFKAAKAMMGNDLVDCTFLSTSKREG